MLFIKGKYDAIRSVLKEEGVDAKGSPRKGGLLFNREQAKVVAEGVELKLSNKWKESISSTFKVELPIQKIDGSAYSRNKNGRNPELENLLRDNFFDEVDETLVLYQLGVELDNNRPGAEDVKTTLNQIDKSATKLVRLLEGADMSTQFILHDELEQIGQFQESTDIYKLGEMLQSLSLACNARDGVQIKKMTTARYLFCKRLAQSFINVLNIQPKTTRNGLFSQCAENILNAGSLHSDICEVVREIRSKNST